MDENIKDAILFAIKEKSLTASTLMNQYRDDYNRDKFNFYYGQYLAYNEVYSLINNS